MRKQFAGAMTGLLSGLLMMGGTALAQQGNPSFGPGEQALYRVQYLGVTTGTAQITVGAPMQQWGQKVWPIISLARTDPMMSAWPIKDKFVTYWGEDGQRSLGSDFFAEENHKRRRQRIQMNADGKSAHVIRQKEGTQPSESTHELPEGSMDVASAAFALRRQGLAEGREYASPVFTGNKSFVMRAKVEGREQMKTALGAREVFRVTVQTDFSEKLQTRRDITLYFTTDPSHVPVRLEADFVLGTVVAEITEYKPGRLLTVNQVASTTGG
ncbi:DUF3108 domain-containing protein [Stigmatella aurantiaca]|uniref:DUF3108 domain-containing protein n=2 Tax=Stigmatella aurantiaca (strain DW4/3-1) TaxID=378806 RepID=Q08NG8_STIAD|nr:DUF3108 domain-containing protein [Stigmatella aurantiaca]EAU62028.1 hypothetical protein STIAU_4744 [Stigmatella aurantiaca DW4/3-1]